MLEVDALGQKCPKPVILALKALARPESEGSVCVTVDEMVAVENLTRLGESRGAKVTVEERDGHWLVSIVGAAVDPELGDVAESEHGDVFCMPAPTPVQTTILVDGSTLGRGSKELGALLLKGLLYAMAQADNPPARALFYNDGAYLTCEGSESLEDIRELERRGCEILTCGTCLDFHGLKDQLAVGGVTNLYAIAEVMLGQDRVITL